MARSHRFPLKPRRLWWDSAKIGQNKVMSKNNPAQVSDRNLVFGVFSILTGVIGWFASFKLLTEYLKTLIEPAYSPDCNISVLVTCGPNMMSEQGSLFGFPNAILGVSVFIIPIIIGVALIGGAKFPVWFWRLYVLGLAGGFVFAGWLQFQSIYNLNTLCPWCMVVWLVIIPLWWTTLLRSWSRGQLGRSQTFRSLGSSLYQWTWVIVVVNYLLVTAAAQFQLNWLFTEFGIGSY